MCNPALALMAVSAAVSAYGYVQQGQATARAEAYNANIATRNAEAAEAERGRVGDAAAIERRRRGELARAQKGELNAKFAAMGVDPGFGTPADLVGDTQQAYDIDRSILGRNEISELERLDKEIADYKDAAKFGQASARSARSAANTAAVGSLIQGGANVASRWIQPTATRPLTVNPIPVQPNLPTGGIPIGG